MGNLMKIKKGTEHMVTKIAHCEAKRKVETTAALQNAPIECNAVDIDTRGAVLWVTIEFKVIVWCNTIIYDIYNITTTNDFFCAQR